MMNNMNRLVVSSSLSNKSTVVVGRMLAKRTFAAGGDDSSLIKTSLYDLHKELGGDMVPFAGYSLPVLYKGLGVMKEHLWCRSDGKSSLFDVSHMGQVQYNIPTNKQYVYFIIYYILWYIQSQFFHSFESNVVSSLSIHMYIYICGCRLSGMEKIVWNF